MRYYSIVISDPVTGAIWAPTPDGRLVKGPPPNPTTQNGVSVVTVSSFQPKYTFTSHPNGKLQPPDPGALNLELDFPIAPMHTPQGGGTLRLSGVGLRMLGQSTNLSGQRIVVSGGMGKGLPLANPGQAGIILQGQVWQPFGNWRGTEQTLDLIVFPSSLTPDGGIVFDWKPGQALKDAILSTLSQAFPDYTPNVNVAPLQIANGQPQQGHYDSLAGFAQALHDITQPIGTPLYKDYPGVTAVTDGKTIFVYDRTAPKRTVQLAFQDLIGQPVWLDPATITFQTVMRADIGVADNVLFPTGVFAPYAQTTAAAAVPNAPAQSKTVFQGTFNVLEMQYFGNFRQPDAESWNTTFRAAVVNPAALTAG